MSVSGEAGWRRETNHRSRRKGRNEPRCHLTGAMATQTGPKKGSGYAFRRRISANRKFRIDRVRRVGEVSCIGRNLRAWIDQERLHATLVTPSRSIPPHGKGHTVLSSCYLRAVDRFHAHVRITLYTKASSERACGSQRDCERTPRILGEG